MTSTRATLSVLLAALLCTFGRDADAVTGQLNYSIVAGPTFTAIQMSNLTFVAGSTNAVGTATATVSSGSNAPTWSLKTSGTDHAGVTCNNYGTSFTISSGGVVSPAAANSVQSYPGVCVQATQSGVSNSPYSTAFTFTGQSAVAASVFDTTRNTGNNFSFSTDKFTASLVNSAASGSNFSAFTTGFHSDVMRYFRLTMTAASTSCGQGLGVATASEGNGNYLGHGGAQSVGFFVEGTTSLNNVSIGTGPAYGVGDVLDFIIDPIGKTVQIMKNGGAPSATFNIAALASQNVSPAISPCSAGDAVKFDGRLAGVGYDGAGIPWDVPSTGQPQYTSIKMSNLTFIAGGTQAVGTATATISSGTKTPTWSIKTSGTDSLGATCNNYGSGFTIGSANGVVTPASGNSAQSYAGVCLQVAQSGVTTYSQAFTLVGQAPSPLVAVVTPSSTTLSCNVAGGTQVATVTSSGGDGNTINSVSLTAGGTDFVLSSTNSLPSNINVASGGITSSGYACASLPTGGATETVTVQISQP